MVIGASNDVMLYRELMDRGIADYLVGPAASHRSSPPSAGCIRDSGSRRSSARPVPLSAPRAASAPPPWPTTSPGPGARLASNVVLADMDLPFGTAGLDFNIDAEQGIAEAIEDSGRLDELLLDRLLVQCNEHLSLLAAPAVLGKSYDFDETAFEQMLEIARAHAPRGSRRAASVDRLGAAHAGLGRRGGHRGRAGSGQFEECQEPGRVSDPGAPQRCPAKARPQPRRHAQAAGDQAGRVRRGAAARADRHHRLQPGTVRHRRQQGTDDRQCVGEIAGLRRLRRNCARVMAGRSDAKAQRKGALAARLLACSPGRAAALPSPQPLIQEPGNETYRDAITAVRQLLSRVRRLGEDGVSAVEFALIAPILFLSLLAMVDVGFAIHERMTIDHVLRAGAQEAMTTRATQVLKVLNTTSAKKFPRRRRRDKSAPHFQVVRDCACPEAKGTWSPARPPAPGQRRPTSTTAFRVRRPTTGMLIPQIPLGPRVQVQVR
jgi:hypothetical protein